MEVGKSLSERQKRRIRQEVVTRLVTRQSERRRSTERSTDEQSDSDDGGNTESHSGPTDLDFDDRRSMSSNYSAEVTESESPTSSPSNKGSTVLSANSSDSEGALAGCRSNLSSSDDRLGDLESMDDNGLSDVPLSESTGSGDDCDSWSSLFDDSESDEDDNLLATVGGSLRKELYPGSMLSNQDFSLGLLSIIQKHNLTYSCVDDLLQFLVTVLPHPSCIPRSNRALIKEFIDCKSSTIVHSCCGYCSKLLGSSSLCSKSECQAASLPNATFVEVPLDSQLKERFSDPKFLQLIEYRFCRKGTPGCLNDIFDGKLYTERSEFFSYPYNLSLSLNYDGAPKFKSSTMQIWPVQMIINELPPHLRSRKEYMLLAGIWCALQKPPCLSFLEPVMKRLKHLAEAGINVHIPGEGTVVSRVQLLCAVVDLPAKAAIMNCIQFNGHYGCSTCLHPGLSVKVGRGSSRVYVYDDSIQMRNHNDHKDLAQKALSTGKVELGVKGFSPLHLLPYFDIIKCIPVDYMHCVLLGVMKQLSTLWFNSSNHRFEWYIGRASQVHDVNTRLLSIKPPCSVSRGPRSIEERKYWKANEWKTFLLYYFPSTMYGILPDKYYTHTLLLSKAIRILLEECISNDRMQLAEKLLKRFYKLLGEYYGIEQCSMNAHLLSHLVYYVKLLGPLWTHSAFAFEGQMGTYVRSSHATHGIVHQIVTSKLLSHKLKKERNIESSMLSTLQRSPEMKGKGKLVDLIDPEMDCINQLLHTRGAPPLQSKTVSVYDKAIVHRQLVYAQINTRVKKRNSFTIKFVAESNVMYGLVSKFMSCTASTEEKHNIACVKVLNVRDQIGPPHTFTGVTDESLKILFEDFITYDESSEVIYIFLDQIMVQCFNVSTPQWSLLTTPVNVIESE